MLSLDSVILTHDKQSIEFKFPLTTAKSLPQWEYNDSVPVEFNLPTLTFKCRDDLFFVPSNHLDDTLNTIQVNINLFGIVNEKESSFIATSFDPIKIWVYDNKNECIPNDNEFYKQVQHELNNAIKIQFSPYKLQKVEIQSL